jgi:hypothetical protein
MPISVWNDSLYLGAEMQANYGSGPKLMRAAALNMDPNADILLNRTVHEWRSPIASEPWFVQLQLQEHSARDLRICWHMRLPSVIRLACHTFNRTGGWATGGYVEDDPFGYGPGVWSGG